MTFTRETATTDALLTDLYLDALLAGAVLDAAVDAASTGGPARNAGGRGPRLDPAARDAADRLRRDLVRVHPSFRFEERLATRLAEAAVAMRLPIAAGAEGRIVPFRPGDDTDPLTGADPADGLLDPAAADPTTTSDGAAGDPARRPTARPLLIGGALTSAAISIAGAAWVAWRLGRPSRGGSPMVRAARAVREGRLIDPGTIATTLEPGLRLRGAVRPGRPARRSARRRLD
jgi:hypothetical protein